MPPATASGAGRAGTGRWFARLAGTAAAVWLGCALWNSVKPMPPGTHVTSLPARLAESQVDFLDGGGAVLAREVQAVERAEQTILIDETPLGDALAEELLLRRRQRPNLRILLLTDPRGARGGGTAAASLSSLERAGMVVARVRLTRLRDSNPLYSSLWRLGIGWWSDPFDETSGRATLLAALRQRNRKADCRQLLVADDGAGGWTSIVMSGPATAAAESGGTVGLEIRGHLAHDIAASELRIGAWSTDDDRFPGLPPAEGRGIGTIDARFLTEGATPAALRDLLATAAAGDAIRIIAPQFEDRVLLTAVRGAADRGAEVELLTGAAPGTQAAAAELEQGGKVEVRWLQRPLPGARYLLFRHRNDVWLELGSADFTRRGFEDLNLAADLELHMPTRAAPARAAADLFARLWAAAAPYAAQADASAPTYWRYRLEEFSGLGIF